MILSDPRIIQVEQEVQRIDPTIFLLWNGRLKTWVVAQDLRRCGKSQNPLHITEPDLVGVTGVGEHTFWKALFTLTTSEGIRIEPNASMITSILCRKCPPKHDRNRWQQFRREQAEAEKRPEQKIQELTQEFRKDVERKVVLDRKIFV